LEREISLLIVDDELHVRETFSEILSEMGYRISVASSGEEALEKLDAEFFDLLLLDHMLPNSELQGLDILKLSRERYPNISAIMVTGHGTVPLVSDAFKAGVLDFVQKPVRPDALLSAVERALQVSALSRENRYLRHQLTERVDFEEIIGQAPEILGIHEQVRRLAAVDVPVLIQGESGTGKELIARALHYSGLRKSGPFIPVNCTAIATELQESELFGHVRGAFTGADSDKDGLFEAASGGTLFLDEIGDASLDTQRKLLRASEDAKIRRVGTAVEIPIDVRIVAATCRKLEEEIRAGEFDDALLYRLNVFSIVLPPLRERREDIPPLVDHLLSKHGSKLGKQITNVDQDALDILVEYNWPGNVRELENIVQRALILTDGDIITRDVLPDDLVGAPGTHLDDLTAFKFSEAKRRFEASYLEIQLKRTGGNISQAARASGMDRNNFRDKMRSHGIDPKEFVV